MTPAIDPAACLATAWQVAPDLPVRLAVVSGLAAVAGWADAQRYFPGKRAFFWLNVVLVLWIAGTTVEHAAVSPGCKSTLALLCWPVILALPVLWSLFLQRYVSSDTQPPRRMAVLLTVLAIAALTAAAYSNGWHAAFYGPASDLGPPVMGLPRMRYAYGPLFLLAAVWGYGWLVRATVLIGRAVQECAPEDRPQWLAFLLMMAVPWTTNVAYVLFGVRLLGGDPTPLSFAVAVVGFGWLIRNSSLLRVVPMSRRLLFTALPDPVLVLDSLNRVIDCNRAGERLASQGALAGASTPVVPRGLALADWPVAGAALAELLQRAPHGEGTVVIDSPPLVLDVRATDIGSGTQRIGRMLQLRDVTERHRTQTRLAAALAQRDAQLAQVAQLEAELREQTLRDPLTGLHNRRALVQRFAQERQHQLATGQPLSLVLLDVDHFKRVNDSHGHAVGDAVLQALAGVFTAGLRASDSVFRIGGEEFALLLPGADATQAQLRVAALRQGTGSGLPLPLDGPPGLHGLHGLLPIGFSAGIATCGRGTHSLDDLLRRADAALYRAKHLGRGRSELAAD
ncbi:histidine kinase N-terminal 7TM domain-containing diguanylate cyclase [Aquabacterium sp. OR-4]|uniref:histidine kinase N-terminal 7TM domain-containing diguanylate cyclase n=1 Tax=Aquabacterium sp. OR-4 TaxID=2978127 RepID=UPI0021B2379D|nr:diguanylate cyclase [Aquabacterium sp. OR-4]MDT7838136.1 diguanylate cyclase [Aquabacterium sp. OR-4]